MEIDFWAARWKEGRIGFHEGRANTFLAKYESRLVAPDGKRGRVFVPLCGKAEDLMFLASLGHDVVGIEAIEDAVKAFFTEHQLTPQVKDDAARSIRTYEARAGEQTITIHAADFFACRQADLFGASAFYDRAALVALPADMRPKYVAHLRELMSASGPQAKGLVVTFDYDQTKMEGPPFALSEAEVRRLFEGVKKMETLSEAPATTPRFLEAGVSVTERCFAVEI